MTKIADHINIVRIDREKDYRVEIDGEEFPYYLIGEVPVAMEASHKGTDRERIGRTEMPTVILRIPANRVTVEDDIRTSTEMEALSADG